MLPVSLAGRGWGYGVEEQPWQEEEEESAYGVSEAGGGILVAD